MASAKVTLEQVARLAGVSSSTVSRYLSGAHPVAEESGAAIESAIQTLNYRPNLVARGLATGRTMTVGVLTQEIVSTFFNEAMRGVEDGLAGHHYDAVYASGHWQPEVELQRFNSLVGRGVEGVILIHPGIDEAALERHAQTVPMVVVGRGMADSRVCSLGLDHHEGAKQAMQHLLELGHRRIAFIAGPPGRGDADERLRAYTEMLAAAGVPFDARLVAAGNYVEPGGLAAMNMLMLPDRQVFICDTHVNRNPTAEQLAEITLLAAEEMRRFGLTPRVALLSHSSFGSSESGEAQAMRDALALIEQAEPGLEIEGEMQGDAALSPMQLDRAFGGARLKGDANLLVMPNLDAANISYSLLKMAAGNGITVGPILLGAAQPVHIIEPSASVRRIVNMTALAVVDAGSQRAE